MIKILFICHGITYQFFDKPHKSGLCGYWKEKTYYDFTTDIPYVVVNN